MASFSPAGKVYNISDYTGYHPGGIPELMRAAGKDGTAFFDEVRHVKIGVKMFTLVQI